MEEREILQIESIAEQVLAAVPDYIWDGRFTPVPVEDIVDSHVGLLVRDVEEMTSAPDCPPIAEGHSLSGLLLAAKHEIWVNAAEAREWPGRRRFTIGHELGHWVMHRDQQTSLFCRHGTVDGGGNGDGEQAAGAKKRGMAKRPPLPRIEQEANHFAAALLMPRGLLADHYRRHEGDPDRFGALCGSFGASMAAMGKRLHQVI